MQYLQQAVCPLADLRVIKASAEMTFKAVNKKLTYENYFELLTSAAQTYDLEHQKHDQ